MEENRTGHFQSKDSGWSEFEEYAKQRVVGGGSGLPGSRNPLSPTAGRLHKEDMAIYGQEPATDNMMLVVCQVCGRVIKSQALLKHKALYHSEVIKGLPPLRRAPYHSTTPIQTYGQSTSIGFAPVTTTTSTFTVPTTATTKKSKVCDFDRHCGVWIETDRKYCRKSIACKIHSLEMRQKVMGRSRPFSELLQEHKKMKKLRKMEKLRSTSLAAGSLAGTPHESIPPKSPSLTSPPVNKIVSDSPPTPTATKSSGFLNHLLGSSPLPQSTAAVYLYGSDDEGVQEPPQRDEVVSSSERELSSTNGHVEYPSPAAVTGYCYRQTLAGAGMFSRRLDSLRSSLVSLSEREEFVNQPDSSILRQYNHLLRRDEPQRRYMYLGKQNHISLMYSKKLSSLLEKSAAPSLTTSTTEIDQLLNVLENKQSYPPMSLPVSTSMSLPMSLPMNLPMSLPMSLPVNLPTSLPVNTHTSLPVNLPTSLPMSLPVNLPTSLPMSLPVNLPTSLPVNTPTSLPINHSVVDHIPSFDNIISRRNSASSGKNRKRNRSSQSKPAEEDTSIIDGTSWKSIKMKTDNDLQENYNSTENLKGHTPTLTLNGLMNATNSVMSAVQPFSSNSSQTYLINPSQHLLPRSMLPLQGLGIGHHQQVNELATPPTFQNYSGTGPAAAATSGSIHGIPTGLPLIHHEQQLNQHHHQMLHHFMPHPHHQMWMTSSSSTSSLHQSDHNVGGSDPAPTSYYHHAYHNQMNPEMISGNALKTQYNTQQQQQSNVNKLCLPGASSGLPSTSPFGLQHMTADGGLVESANNITNSSNDNLPAAAINQSPAPHLHRLAPSRSTQSNLVSPQSLTHHRTQQVS